MKGSFILDCSVAVAWCFEDETSAYTDSVLASFNKANAIVPKLWHIEVANVLLMAQKRGRINDNGIFHFLSLLEKLPIMDDKTDRTIIDLVMLSQKYQLTSYDGCYLNLCLQYNLPLATMDKKLISALQSAGGKIYQP